MDNDADNHFETFAICNRVKLKSYLNREEDNSREAEAFICGKMFSHSAIVKYSFKACDFFIYVSKYNALFHSEMNSENCFSDALKWTPNFFKRIRACLNSSNEKKNSFFTIAHADENNKLKPNDDGDNIETSKAMYFELHFVLDTEDIAAFRLQLEMIIEDQPQLFLMNKIIAIDKEEEEELKAEHERYFNKQIEICKLEKEIERNKKDYANKEKDCLYKFYLLNKEKNNKIEQLLNEIESKKE